MKKTIKHFSVFLLLMMATYSVSFAQKNQRTENYTLHEHVILVGEASNKFLQTRVNDVINSEERKSTGIYRIVFSDLGEELKEVKVGNVLTCAEGGIMAPYGYAGKVMFINQLSDGIELGLQPVDLKDIFKTLHYSTYKKNNDPNYKNNTIDCGGLSGCYNATKTYTPKPGFNISLEFDLCAEIGFNVDIDWGLSPDLESVSFCAGIQGSIKPSMELDITELDAVSNLLSKIPAPNLPPITLYGVVTLHPKVTPSLSVENLSIGGSGDAIAFGIEPVLTLSAYGEIGHNGSWYKNGDVDLSGTLNPVMDLEEDDGVTVALQLRLSYHPYNLDDVYIGLAPEVNGTVEKNGCQKKVFAGAGLQASASFDFEFDPPGPGSVTVGLGEYTAYIYRNTNLLPIVTLGEDCMQESPQTGPSNPSTGSYNPYLNCSNGLQDFGETGVDCGGSYCAPCCNNNGYQDFGETGVDCGGPCAPCQNYTYTPPANSCSVTSDYSQTYNNNLTVNFYENTINAGIFYWTFGDGTTSTQANPIHTFPSSGSYEVCLNIANWTCADDDAKCKVITVNSSPPPAPPPVNCSPYAYFQGTWGQFDVDLQVLTATNVDSYFWTFGDGHSVWQVNPSHTYANPGTYDVCLTIYNNQCGISGQGCIQVVIDPGSCQANHFVNYPLNTSLEYEAHNSIIGSNSIASNKSVNFDAGNLVVLQNGFWAKPNSNFRALIEGCGGASKTESNNNNLSLEVFGSLANADIEELDQESKTENELIKVIAFPNPFDNQLKVNIWGEIQEGGILALFDLQGRLLYEESLIPEQGTVVIDTHFLPKGVYLLRTQIGEYSSTEKVIK